MSSGGQGASIDSDALTKAGRFDENTMPFQGTGLCSRGFGVDCCSDSCPIVEFSLRLRLSPFPDCGPSFPRKKGCVCFVTTCLLAAWFASLLVGALRMSSILRPI